MKRCYGLYHIQKDVWAPLTTKEIADVVLCYEVLKGTMQWIFGVCLTLNPKLYCLNPAGNFFETLNPKLKPRVYTFLFFAGFAGNRYGRKT